MAYDEFLVALRETRSEFEWSAPGRMIRAWRGVCSYCPITAVATMQLGKIYLIYDWRVAAEALGLSRSDALEISRAADFSPFPFNQQTRQDILDVIFNE